MTRTSRTSSLSLEERARRERLLARAAAGAEACRKCAIGYARRHNVYGEGDPLATLMVIGEGPGENEDLQGRPFVGRAGQLLERMLAAIGLAREDVYICNTVKCRPTSPGPNGPRNRAPELDEMANCRPFLDEQIGVVAPGVILALGAPAAKSFLGRDFQITKMRGRWYAGPNGIALMASFHPAYILRQTGGEIEAVKRLVWHDLRAVRTKLDELAALQAAPRPDEEPRETSPEPQQAGLFGETRGVLE